MIELDFPEQPTAVLPAITTRTPVYPRPRWQHPMFFVRLASLLALLAILAVSAALYFSTPNTLSTLLLVKPTPTYATCAQETLIRGANGTISQQINEVC